VASLIRDGRLSPRLSSRSSPVRTLGIEESGRDRRFADAALAVEALPAPI
jgi:hypothetical protein